MTMMKGLNGQLCCKNSGFNAWEGLMVVSTMKWSKGGIITGDWRWLHVLSWSSTSMTLPIDDSFGVNNEGKTFPNQSIANRLAGHPIPPTDPHDQPKK
jgi:hypothetical protein